MSLPFRLLPTLAATAAAAAVLTGCTTTPSSVSGADLEKKISRDLAQQTQSSQITCRKIAYKRGARSTCDQRLTTSDGVAGDFKVAITMTKAGGDGKYEISYRRVLPAQEFHVTGEAVAADLRDQWNKTQDTPATKVTCPDLPGKVGTKVTCEVVAGDTVKAITTVTEADGSTLAINYDFTRA